MTEESKPVEMGERGLVLSSLDEMQRFATMVLASNLAPSNYKQGSGAQQIANICVALQYGLELGLSPMQSLQGVAVINGKPTVYGDSMLGLCYASGLMEEFKVNVQGTGDTRGAVCTIKRRGVENTIVRAFTIADAKKAKLWGRSGPWTQYPERMLEMRARGFALRDAFADVLRGVISAEEAQDYPTEEPREAEVVNKERDDGRHFDNEDALPLEDTLEDTHEEEN